MYFRRCYITFVFGTLLASAANGQTVKASETEQRALSESFAKLALGFCAAAVSQTETSVATLDKLIPGIQIRGPLRLSEIGAWSASLQDRLHAKPESTVYSAITTLTNVDRFHIAYALEDGSRCIAMAQEMPTATIDVLTRIRSDTGYKLELEGNEQSPYSVYSHASTGTQQSFSVAIPSLPNTSRVEEVRFQRLSGDARPRTTDAERQAWSEAIFATCFRSAQHKIPVTVADFGEFMTERPKKNGDGVNIVSSSRYPASMLFAENAPQTGCRITLSAGVEDNAKVLTSWREQLAKLSAKRKLIKRGEEEFVVSQSSSSDYKTTVRCTIAEVVNGLYVISILSEGK